MWHYHLSVEGVNRGQGISGGIERYLGFSFETTYEAETESLLCSNAHIPQGADVLQAQVENVRSSSAWLYGPNQWPSRWFRTESVHLLRTSRLMGSATFLIIGSFRALCTVPRDGVVLLMVRRDR